jgi:4-hydroxy-tetrahydrodipicolinate reductase
MTNLKIALSGYGQMGRQIHELSEKANCEVVKTFDNSPNANDLDGFDVVIDFTEPSSVFSNVRLFAEAGKNIVLGTTGWYDRESELKEIISSNGTGLIWGSNFSVGVNLFFRIIESASKLAGNLDDFDWMIHEMHHKRKKDSPSGTAESLAKIVVDNVSSKNGIEVNRIDEVDSSKLHVSSTRGGEINGRHTIYMDSISDSIELTHRAKNRKGFATGSLLAAKWIADKKGFFNYSDVFEEIIG